MSAERIFILIIKKILKEKKTATKSSKRDRLSIQFFLIGKFFLRHIQKYFELSSGWLYKK